MVYKMNFNYIIRNLMMNKKIFMLKMIINFMLIQIIFDKNIFISHNKSKKF